MNQFLFITHGCSIVLYAFIVWRYLRVHRSETRLLDELQEEGTVQPRTRPILFAVCYGVATIGVMIATTMLITFRPHWL